MKRFARWGITVGAIAVLGLGAYAFRVASGSTQSKTSQPAPAARMDLLAEIDPRPFQAQLTQAQGQLVRDEALLRNARVDLAALRILETEAHEQADAVQAAERSLRLTTNQYRAGVVSYLNVVVAQTAALTSEQTAVGIAGRRLGAAVLLVKALGGGWTADRLPTADEITRK